MNESQNNIQVAIAEGDNEAVKAKLEEAGVEVFKIGDDSAALRSFEQRMAIASAMLSAAGAMGSTAHFPQGIRDGGLGTALRRGRRHRPMVVDTTARRQQSAEIQAWNARVDAKKAEKRRAKASHAPR